jgi:hypothetical protein
MKVIHGARRSGKTTQLIKEAAEKDAVIVCATPVERGCIARAAEKMNIKIRKPKTVHEMLSTEHQCIDNVLIDNAEHVLINLLGPCLQIHTITINDESNTEQRYVNADPDFSDAEVGDLVWNDAYGEGKIKHLGYNMVISFSNNVNSTACRDGRYTPDSPKPTFFYSDGKGNNYLTKRPKQEIDFTNLVPGTQIKLCDGAVVYFLSYVPLLSNPICVAMSRNKDGVFCGVRFIYKHIVKSVEAE